MGGSKWGNAVKGLALQGVLGHTTSARSARPDGCHKAQGRCNLALSSLERDILGGKVAQKLTEQTQGGPVTGGSVR